MNFCYVPQQYLGLPLSVRQLRKVDFQYLEDKAAGKLVTWEGQSITTIGRTTLVRSVITSQAVFSITSLIVPQGTLHNINKIERAFLWSGSDKTTGAKCKVNWDMVCRTTIYGGLGILNTDKFARALRLRWPWYEWKEPTKLWVGLGNPCTEEDMDFFYASTTIIVGNGAKTPFWDSPWLLGRKPKDIAPLIFQASKRKRSTLRQALRGNAWMTHIKHDTIVSVAHIRELFSLWALVHDFHLDDHVEDDIVWKHADDGQYSAATAYKAQFLGLTHSPIHHMVWRACPPPKVKFFAWLTLQDRNWTADRLERRGWDNCGLCPLCKREQESGIHLFVKCRFSIRLWRSVIDKFGLVHMDTSNWHLEDSLMQWWDRRTDMRNPNRRAMASLTMLVSWTIWNERNARVFRNKSAPPPILLQNIVLEAKLWVTAGAKKLGRIVVRE